MTDHSLIYNAIARRQALELKGWWFTTSIAEIGGRFAQCMAERVLDDAVFSPVRDLTDPTFCTEVCVRPASYLKTPIFEVNLKSATRALPAHIQALLQVIEAAEQADRDHP